MSNGSSFVLPPRGWRSCVDTSGVAPQPRNEGQQLAERRGSSPSATEMRASLRMIHWAMGAVLTAHVEHCASGDTNDEQLLLNVEMTKLRDAMCTLQRQLHEKISQELRAEILLVLKSQVEAKKQHLSRIQEETALARALLQDDG